MTADGVPPNAPVVASRYCFDDVVVDLNARTLVRAGEVRTLEPKAFAVLALLLERPGELVPRDDLLDAVWGHRHVTPGVLTRVIAQLRHALDDDAQHPRYIQTRHALGYSFIGELRPDLVVNDAPTVQPPSAEGDARVSTAEPAAQPSSLPREPQTRGYPRAAWIVAMTLAAVVLVATAIGLYRQRVTPLPHAIAPSVAVLPFRSLGPDPADRYFAEGLGAEMQNALAGVHGLQVAPWRADAGNDARSLGRRLGVASVLDAAVRRGRDRVQIDARLVETSSGGTLWSRHYDRPVGEIFAMQSAIAADVAAALVGALPDAGEGLRRRLAPTRNVAAFDAYLRGLHELLSGDRGNQRALDYFRQALAKDPGFARAQAGICRTETWRFESQRNPDAFESAQLACRTAENMDPTIGEVQLAMGDLYRVQGDDQKAGRYYRGVVDYPGLRAQALVGLAKLDVAGGRVDDALAHFREAQQANPSDAHVYAELGYQQYLANRRDDAIASMAQATRMAPDNGDYWSLYGGLLLTAGRTDAAEPALERAATLEPDDRVLANLGTVKYQHGDYAAAVALYRRATALSPDTYINFGNLGDALLARESTAGLAPEAFRRAAELAQHYVDFNGGEATDLAALGWYRANIGERERALAFVRASEARDGKDENVAYYNAETLLRLGDVEGARQRLAIARQAGIAESRLTTNRLFQRAGLVAAR
ncbi:hypothetical protein DWG18_04205 [Lysobacter sp. TY2-98]|uniref:tetratricopeptide repeat protein n=1 Tax=Lysobacter sp. TY2-98 TaxID=2290922 RepID=UPI000E20A49A|nr:tetratricopeptide repeat protein [Lysobacter sp. TY2-98]AXK71570.1 hypothetical protein DWG18_04205 [Lysobacter sp. TY2-98]